MTATPKGRIPIENEVDWPKPSRWLCLLAGMWIGITLGMLYAVAVFK